MKRLAGYWAILSAAAIAIVMLALFLAVGDRGLPLRLETETLDLRFRLRPARPYPAPIVIAEIDNASIAEIGRWPWSRKILAQLLDRLHGAGAKVICLDLLLTEPQLSPLQSEIRSIETAIAPLLQNLDAANKALAAKILSELPQESDPDARLAEAIGRDGPVIVPFSLDLQPASRPPGSVSLPPALARAAYYRRRGSDPDFLPAAVGVHLPVAALARNALLAHVTTVPDGIGGYRYDYPVLRYADAYLPSLSLEAVRVFLGVPKSQAIVDRGQGIDLGASHVPTDRGMRLLVNYYPPGAFETVSFADVLFGRIPQQVFRGKIVLVGGDARALGDAVVTPYEPALAGVERHATLIENMLDRDFLKRGGSAVALDAIFILLGGLGVGMLARWGTTATVGDATVLIAGLAIFDYLAFARFGWWLNFIFPAATIALCAAVIVGGKYLIEWRRERFIRDAFSRYLHPDLVAELCRTRRPLQLGGEERELTVLFADIRDFTSVAEALAPSELTALVNEFFAAMTDRVQAHRGMVDKYVGDSLMAVFGAPLPDPEHALNACRAAFDMHSALAKLHDRWQAEKRPCFEMRVGVNSGRMVIGNVGTERHFDYTVMGDEVNVASRLEGANKELSTEILISASTREAAGNAITVHARGLIAVKGRVQPVAAFELLAVATAGSAELAVDGDRELSQALGKP